MSTKDNKSAEDETAFKICNQVHKLVKDQCLAMMTDLMLRMPKNQEYVKTLLDSPDGDLLRQYLEGNVPQETSAFNNLSIENTPVVTEIPVPSNNTNLFGKVDLFDKENSVYSTKENVRNGNLKN